MSSCHENHFNISHRITFDSCYPKLIQLFVCHQKHSYHIQTQFFYKCVSISYTKSWNTEKKRKRYKGVEG